MILALTLAQIGGGLLLATVLMHRSEVGRKLLQLLGAIASLLLLPWMLPGLLPQPAAWLLLAAALLTLLWFVILPRLGEGTAMVLRFLAAGLACGGMVLAVLPYRRAVGAAWFEGWFLSADVLTSSLLLGSTLGAMLLGHNYLVTAGMSVGPLLRLTAVMGFACLTKVATLLGGLALYGWPDPGPQGWWFALLLPPGLFFVVRVLLGVAGPIALTPLVWKTARMHATQSATGILYASVVLVLIGELTANFLFLWTPLPF